MAISKPKSKSFQHLRRLTASQAREGFSEALGQVAHGYERIIVARNGKEIAALVPIQDLKILQSIEDQMDIAAADKAIADYERNGGTSSEKLKKKLGL